MARTLEQYLALVFRGQEPTLRSFTCPACGGCAHMSVALRTTMPNSLLSVSAWCDDCDEAIEMDGVAQWPGWARAAPADQSGSPSP